MLQRVSVGLAGKTDQPFMEPPSAAPGGGSFYHGVQTMRDDVVKTLKDLYESSKNWQTFRKIEFNLTFEQFVKKFSLYRLKQITGLIDSGRWERFQANPEKKLVLSWVTKESRQEGIMHPGNCAVMTAAKSKKIFRMQKGGKHTAATKQKMKQPKSEATKAKMALAQQKRRQKEKQA